MPYKCSVYGCKGNYSSGEKVSIFQFPKDEHIRKIWILKIMRKDFTPTKSSRICELHFRKEDILYEAEFFDEKSGRLLKSKLKHPRLREGAIPVYCPNPQTSTASEWEYTTQKRQHLEDSFLQKFQEASFVADNYQRRSFEKESEAVVKIKFDSDLGLQPKTVIASVTPSNMFVVENSTTLITPDIDPPDLSTPGPSSRMDTNCSTTEQDVRLALTCEVYPADDSQPVILTKIKEEPIDVDEHKQDILFATVTEGSSVTNSQVGSLLQPPVLIKEEPVYSEEEL